MVLVGFVEVIITSTTDISQSSTPTLPAVQHFMENLPIFLGIWGAAKIILRIWGAKEKYFQGAEEFFSWILGDQCIIFMD